MEVENGYRVAGNDDDVGQSPAVATLMPPAATPVPITTAMGTCVFTFHSSIACMF
jgi:hypothetical protein